jgi:hypothetical protein
LNSNADRRWNPFAGVDFNRRSATAQQLRRIPAKIRRDFYIFRARIFL